MSEINLPIAYRVEIWEHECGWGAKIDEVKYFDSEQSAKQFCAEYNSKNTAPTAPDWYMQAEYCGETK